ncbi:endonuclease domain-containing protein [Salinimicrobium sp. TH3]|uniref:endonuclease domain-containing protein n=1 Tax=Salinimicrobium sp. TH3 TaxID=2997342 RepID=UPI0022749B20|nr:endonuclease domain-containing protein [Salinimicrobium sp. TH3]MCY2685769.1 endonuclease domain-containing protein [Salinimicrobium sp. TH3]
MKDDLYHQDGMWKGAPPENFGRAKFLRKNMTPAEILLWEKLQNPPFSLYKFRRQHPVQYYIVDFYSHSLRLAIEVDGKYHETLDQNKRDLERTEILRLNHLNLIRFTNKNILNHTDDVLQEIEEKIELIKSNR